MHAFYICVYYTPIVYVFVIQIYFYLYLAHDLCERKASLLTYKTNHLHWVSILCACLNRAASRPMASRAMRRGVLLVLLVALPWVSSA